MFGDIFSKGRCKRGQGDIKKTSDKQKNALCKIDSSLKAENTLTSFYLVTLHQGLGRKLDISSNQ